MVLIIIDTQKLITNCNLYNFSNFLNNIQKLIDTSRKNKIEIIYIRHDDGQNQELTKGTEGFEIYEKFKPINDEKIFDKIVNSPFKESGLLEYLREKNETDLIIAGLQTDYCIDATVKCGFEHNFNIIVPAYCNTTIDNKFMSGKQCYEYYNNFIWPNRYARCISLDETLEIINRN